MISEEEVDDTQIREDEVDFNSQKLFDISHDNKVLNGSVKINNSDKNHDSTQPHIGPQLRILDSQRSLYFSCAEVVP